MFSPFIYSYDIWADALAADKSPPFATDKEGISDV